MPAGSGSRPSSASSGAVEAECQHEAEADDFDGYADEDGIDDIDDTDDIDDICSNHGMGLHACYCCYVVIVHNVACVLARALAPDLESDPPSA